MPTKTPRRKQDYSPTEIQAALTALAYYGSSERASQDTGIPARTLRDWRVIHHKLYLEIQERSAPELEAIAAGNARELILRSSEAEHGILDRLNEPKLSSKELSELAGALQRVTTSKGINTTKLLELTGRPTSIVEHREGTDILRRLGTKVPGLVIEATATEDPAPKPLPPQIAVTNAREARSNGASQPAD